jgi:UDPglucose 6-dehydrogenase
MRVAVIGAGYVGLVSGICLAEKGHEVTCVDMDSEKVERIRRGISPMYEKGVEELLRKHLGRGFDATTDLGAAVRWAEVSIVAVGTPFDGTEIDLGYVREAARQVGAALRDHPRHHVVVVKSTVVPGTTDDVVLPILADASGRRPGADFGVGMNPEFLREGEAVSDFLQPDRIVMGGMDERTLHVLQELYRGFPAADRILTTNRTAEMIKYASNGLLATLISYANEIGNLCAAQENIDAVEVMRGVHLDRRFSPILADGRRITPGFTTYLEAGCGFGGSCFPKDVKALVAHGRRAGLQMDVLGAVIDVNERQPQEVLRLLRKHFPRFHGLRATVLGLAFKPGTDDMRESPSIPVVRALQSEGARVTAYDPAARQEAERVFASADIAFSNTLDDALEGAEAVVLMTKWEEFSRVPDILQRRRRQPVVVDGRRMLDKLRLARYEGIGA